MQTSSDIGTDTVVTDSGTRKENVSEPKEGETITTTSNGKYNNYRRNSFRNGCNRGGYGNRDSNHGEHRSSGNDGQNTNFSTAHTCNTYNNNQHIYPNNTT